MRKVDVGYFDIKWTDSQCLSLRELIREEASYWDFSGTASDVLPATITLAYELYKIDGDDRNMESRRILKSLGKTFFDENKKVFNAFVRTANAYMFYLYMCENVLGKPYRASLLEYYRLIKAAQGLSLLNPRKSYFGDEGKGISKAFGLWHLDKDIKSLVADIAKFWENDYRRLLTEVFENAWLSASQQIRVASSEPGTCHYLYEAQSTSLEEDICVMLSFFRKRVTDMSCYLAPNDPIKEQLQELQSAASFFRYLDAMSCGQYAKRKTIENDIKRNQEDCFNYMISMAVYDYNIYSSIFLNRLEWIKTPRHVQYHLRMKPIVWAENTSSLMDELNITAFDLEMVEEDLIPF